MNRKTTYAVRAGLCAVSLVVCAQVGRAQTAELPQVPNGLTADVKAMLSSRRETLVNEEARLRSIAVDHNGKCRQVSAQSSAAPACAARQDSLHGAAARLKVQKEAFRNAIDELNRLTEEESALSQAIRAKVEEMRGLVDAATETGQEQLHLLSEELKKQIERRRGVRVRRTVIAVAAVRG